MLMVFGECLEQSCADWRRVGGRSSSLGGMMCSDVQEVSSEQWAALPWQQQNVDC